MRVQWALTVLIVFVISAGAGLSAPQTRPWRIGVAGGYSNGFWGMLGREGLPRERMMENRVGDPAYLKQFDVVLITMPSVGAGTVAAAVEEFVRDGGIAVTEGAVWPSETALPGRRITQTKGPNFEFVEADSPLGFGLARGGRLPTTRRPASSIIPAAGHPDTYVLARFTDEGANDDVKGVFRDGDKGSPGLILFRYGEGWWLWSGTWTGYWTALSGPHFVPAILGSLAYASRGELISRWDRRAVAVEDLLTSRVAEIRPPDRKPGPGQPAAPGDGYQVLDDSLELSGDFDLVAGWPAGSSARVLCSFWNADWQRRVDFADGIVCIVSVRDGIESVLAATAPGQIDGAVDHEIHVRRRNGDVLVRVDGQPVLCAVDGPPMQGIVACSGLIDPICQPAAPTEFADEFMRANDEDSDWSPVSGQWRVQQETGDRGQGQVAQSVNPFRYEANAEADKPALSATGMWFWDDYQAEVRLRPACDKAGIAAHFISDTDHLAFTVTLPAEGRGPAEARLICRRGGEETTLATGPCAAIRGQWAKIAIRVSGGYVQGLVDDVVVLHATDPVRATGGIALVAQAGQALFDDVLVKPWVAMPTSCDGVQPSNWITEEGTLRSAEGAPGWLSLTGSPEARAVSAWEGGAAYEVRGDLCLGTATEAGLALRYTSPDSFYRVALCEDAPGTHRASLIRHVRDKSQVLAEIRLAGDRDSEHDVLARLSDAHIQVRVDGKLLFDGMDDGPRRGGVGIWARDGQARFGAVAALPVEPEEQLVDDLTPSFAGIIDKATWAGKANFLVADPDDLALFWHTGEFVSDVTVKAGVLRQPEEPVTVASLILGDGEDPESGYEARFARTWGEEGVELTLLRKGEAVEVGTLDVPSDRDSFEIEFARQNGALVMRVDGETVLIHNDSDRLDMRRVGMKLVGSLLRPDDTRIETPNVRVYTFGQAPTDWISECGTWEVASRWSCSPGWTWFAGWSFKDAWCTNKEIFRGDQRLDMFVGAKMVDLPNNQKQEVLRDIRLGLCTTPGDISSGYRFVLGGKGNTWTAILRDGKVLAETAWGLPQGGLHNDWALVSAAKRGNVLTVSWEGHEVLRAEDPDPLAQGHAAIGTFDNGIMVPKITIFGQVVAREPVEAN
ncbi:MAG: hypothetical protein HPY44_17190 [Armatimonadetes bacterium]|nr:hypothetical protein [Armatimonadota bacterium]